MDLELTSRVGAVTVYSRQARVTTKAKATLESGAHRLIVGDLPLTMDASSVRAGGSGTARVRLHGIEVQKRHYEETPVAKVRDLEGRIEELEDELQAINDEQRILEAQAGYLEGLRNESEQYARGLALGRSSVEKQAEIGLFFKEQDQALRRNVRELEQEKRALNKALDRVRRELETLVSTRPRERYQVIIDAEVLAEGEFETELVYNVNRASWTPLYDARLVATQAGHELVVSGIAQISQSSGQDWSDVDLKVSTARTELNRRIPELKPWYVDVLQPPMPRVAAAPAKSMASSQAYPTADSVAEGAERIAESVAAEIVSEEGGATVTFAVVGKGNIPSDGAPHKTLLFERRLPTTVDYVAVPKHTDAVYRRLMATNDGTAPLLAGAIQLFAGDRYIGTSRTDYVPVGDEVELTLGVEERLTVERELVRRDVDKTRLRDRRQILYGYEITLKNLMSDPVNVEVHDHLPVSRHEEIKVRLLSCEPEPAEHDDLNLMEWHLFLENGAEQKLSYQFQVEYPRSLRVMGLLD